MRRFLKIGGLSLVGIGGLYGYRLKQNRSWTASEFNDAQEPGLTNALTLLQEGKLAEPLNLYRYTTCPFCGTVKAFLDFHGIPHKLTEVEPMFKSQLQGHGYTKIPQLRLGGDDGPLMVDSERIIERLEPIYAKGWCSGSQDDDTTQWREWAREKLVRYVVLNTNRTLKEAWDGYSYIDDKDTIPYANKLFLKIAGAPIMYLVARLATAPKLKTLGYDGGDEREAMHREVADWCSQGLSGKPFHGGDTPDLADLDSYGIMQSVRGHELYEDLAGRNQQFDQWLMRMDEELEKRKVV